MLFDYKNGKGATKSAGTLLAVLMVLSAFSLLFSTPVAQTTTNDDLFSIPEEFATIFDDASDIAQVVEAAKTAPIELKIGENLGSYLREGIVSDEIVSMNNNPSIMTILAPGASLDAISKNMKIDSSADLGMFVIAFGKVTSPDAMKKLAAEPSVLQIVGDDRRVNDAGSDLIELERADFTIDPVQPDQTFTREYLGIDTIGQDGSGVTVGVFDSGVDFGQDNLGDALALDDDGFPASFMAGGIGIGLTPFEVDATADSFMVDETLDIFVHTSNYAPSIGNSVPYAGYGWALPDNVNFSLAGVDASVSGTYKFGILYEDLDSGHFPFYQYFYALLVDTTTAGVYDKIYFSWDYSAVANWYTGYCLNHLNFEIDFWELSPAVNATALPIVTVNHTTGDLTFKENGTFVEAGEWTSGTKSNFILAHDFDSDGYNDISAGSLTNVLDIWNVFDDEFVTMLNGIDPAGNGFGVMYDSHGHGTVCASSVASRGTNTYKLYDNYSVGGQEGYYGAGYDFLADNDTDYNIYGMATGADVMAMHLFSNNAYMTSMLWQAGFDLVLPEAPTDFGSNWVYTGKHVAQISSNSWGWVPAIKFTYGAPGISFNTVLIDILSMPGYFDPSYPGMLFCFSSGNDGTGYGTFGDFSMSTSALTVGASNMMHVHEPLYGTNVVHDQLASFSSRGPSTSGWTGVDVLMNGFRGISTTAVWDHGYWDNRPEMAGYYGSSGNLTFGAWQGTSLACPLTAGIAALVFEAGSGLTPQDVKMIIKTTAKDLGYDAFTQGTGRVDPVAAVAMAVADDGWVSSNETNWVNSMALADTLAMWFTDGEYSDWEDLPGTYYNSSWADMFASYPDGIVDTDFYAGILQPGETSLGAVDIGLGTDVTPVFDNLTATYSGSFVTDNDTAQYSPLYDELFIPVNLTDLWGDDYDSIVDSSTTCIDIFMTYDDTETEGGAEPAAAVVFNFIDDGDGLISWGPTFGGTGEYGGMAFTGVYGTSVYFPISMPDTAFDHPHVALKFLGTWDNRTEGTFNSVGGNTVSWSVNVYQRQAWDVVEATLDTGSVYDINVTVPEDAMPGVYGGYLEITGTGYLVPVSYAVWGTVVTRTAAEMSTFTADKETPMGNYVFNTGASDAGTGDYRYFPLKTAIAANMLYLRVTTTTACSIDVFVLDYMGVSVDHQSSSSGTELQFLSDISENAATMTYYIAINAIDIGGHETEFTLEAACSATTLDSYMDNLPSFSLDGLATLDENGDLVYRGPHVNVTAGFSPGTLFPEIAVSDVELLIAGVTTESYHDVYTGTCPAAGGGEVLLDFVEGDYVEFNFDWDASSGCDDMDCALYDPTGTRVGFDELQYGGYGGMYDMGSGDKPEWSYKTITMTGEWTFTYEEYHVSTTGTDYELTIDILRTSPLTAAGSEVTFDSQYVSGNWIQDGAYNATVTGYTNSPLVYSFEQEYFIHNWLAPDVEFDVASREITTRGSVTIEWTGIDPNGPDGDFQALPSAILWTDFSDDLSYEVYWRINSPIQVVTLPGGIIHTNIMAWKLLTITKNSTFAWDLTDSSMYPDGMVCEFRVLAKDGSGELGLNGYQVITLNFGEAPPVTVTTVIDVSVTTTTVTETVTASGLTLLAMLSGLVGLFVLRKRRK